MPIVEPEVTLGPGGELPGLNSFPKVMHFRVAFLAWLGIHLIDYVLHSKACHDSGADYSIEENAYWSERVYSHVFRLLNEYGILMEGMLLKPNMCLPGLDVPTPPPAGGGQVHGAHDAAKHSPGRPGHPLPLRGHERGGVHPQPPGQPLPSAHLPATPRNIVQLPSKISAADTQFAWNVHAMMCGPGR